MDVEGLTLASKQTREIILNLWFHVLHNLTLEYYWDVIVHWERLYEWTRCVRRFRTLSWCPHVNFRAIHYWTSNPGPKAFLESSIRLNSISTDVLRYNEVTPIILQLEMPGNVLHLDIRVISWLNPSIMRCWQSVLPIYGP